MNAARLLGSTALVGAAGLAYSVLETRWFVERHVSAPVLEPGADPIRILHLSDLHITPNQHRKRAWVSQLARLEPDLVISTGDHLAHRDAVPSVIAAHGALLERPGVFVFGSNDYFSPVAKNPAKYLTGGTGSATRGAARRTPDLPTEDLRDALTSAGWLDLNNRRDEMLLGGRRVTFVGVDDPHIQRDRLDDEPADPSADLAIGVAHAPYRRVLDRWTALGFDMIFAGHTHGGQLRIPGVGALVTNCDLPRAFASGLHQWRVGTHEPSWLHVSAGLGTSPYTPVRFCCRPEATIVTLTG